MKTATTRPLETPFPFLTTVSRSMEQMWGLRQKDGEDTELSPNEAAKEFDRTFQEGHAMARTIVQDSLALQKQWVEGCCKLTADMKTAPQEVQRAAEQVNETLSTLIDLRATLWEQWLDSVSGLENGSMPALMQVLDGVEQTMAHGSTHLSDDGSASAAVESENGSTRSVSGKARKAG